MARKRSRPRLGYIDKPPIDEIWMLRHCTQHDPSDPFHPEDDTAVSCEAEAFRDADAVVERQEEITWNYYNRLHRNYQQNKTPFSNNPLSEEDRAHLAKDLTAAHERLKAGDPDEAFEILMNTLNDFNESFRPTLMIHQVPVYRLEPTDLKPVSMSPSSAAEGPFGKAEF